MRFSIGAGDRQALQPPLNSTMPVSHDSVALFFDQMGELDPSYVLFGFVFCFCFFVV